MRWCILILFLLPQCLLYGQFKSIGVPEIRNILVSEYGGSAQNWDIIDDANGNIYIANNSGILRFDGEDWEIHPVANHSIVRSLAYGNDDKVYVGAYNEIGVLEHTMKEGIRYHSLNHLIPEFARNFDDVWNIYQTRFGVVFQSFEYLYILQDSGIQVIEPADRFGNSYFINDDLYAIEKGIGLRVLKENALQTVSDDPLFTSDEIRFIVSWQADGLLIGSQNNGLFTLQDGILKPWETEVSEELKIQKLYCGSFHKDRYLFGTIKSGLFVTNNEGAIQQHLSRSNGLQNNTILSLFVDRQDNIWLGLDIGIDFLKSSLPLSIINDNFNIAATYATAVFNGRLYIGTNQGLFTKRLANISSPTNITYDLVEGTQGQVWNLSVRKGQLLCGHHNGAYLINGTGSKKLTGIRGIWNFKDVPGRDGLLISGTYDGLITFATGEDGTWKYKNKVKGMDISSRELVIQNDQRIWMSHGYRGLFHFHLNETLDSVISMKEYVATHNLPESLPYILHELEGDFFISTSQGIYTFDEAKDIFFKPEDLNQRFGSLQLIYLLKEDPKGNIWYSAKQGIGVFRLLENGTYKNIYSPFLELTNKRVSPFDNIYIQDPENIFIGTQNGLVHYDPSIYKNYFEDTYVYINRINISSKKHDSLWYTSGNRHLDEQAIEEDFSLPHAFNNISFRFNSPDMENTGKVTYRHKLINFDDEWSEWTAENRKEYTNLKGGLYKFEVQAKNIYNNTSSIDSFRFFIEPPFYRSNTARILYGILAMAFFLSAVIFFRWRIRRAKLQEKNRQIHAFREKEKQFEEQMEAAEKEVVYLKNERLEVEMRHKNKELANSTYHIIQKNKFLNTLKQELSKLSESAKSDFVEKELKKISRKIDRDIQEEKNWEVFERYFDEVHQEFNKRLKELHPDLTPNEIRLCAYLRMNISSKEIAPLMNISIRGVEVSRYRVRKKLNLDRNINLTEYIMNL